MSKIQILQIHVLHLRELERHLAVASGSRKRQLTIRIRAAQSKLQILLRKSE